ncbi:MAG: AAC(3) family N-acetyltransferase [Phycisphaerales bacterium]|nr:MAG: AAC(3) family N-acetyltransferase [Phycisphaerales bacterium]
MNDVIERTRGLPATVESLTADLVALGVERGMVLIAHTSLSSLGWVCGGPVAVIAALEQALGPEGTLVMPTFSGDLSDPATWKNPPVPEDWWETIRETTPPYDVRLSPTRGVGLVPETFIRRPGVRRSAHPLVSFTAWGAEAARITDAHALDFGFGTQSPLARVYDLEGSVLLLGVGHAANTSLHLGEYRALYPGCPVVQNGAPVLAAGVRKWVTIQDIDVDDSDFEVLGADYEQGGGLVRRGCVACAEAQLIPQRSLVDYATHWIAEHRG